MKHFIFKLSLCLFLSIVGGVCAFADGPEMNKVYIVPMSITQANSYQIPASAFLADATSATITVTNSSWVTFTVGYYGSNLADAPYGAASFSFDCMGENLETALRGNLYVSLEGKSDIVVTVLNKDANYKEPGDSGNGGNNNEDPGYEPDYTNQLDSDNDGKLEPCAEYPAFGALVDYNVYPQLTDIPSMYITVYKTDDQGQTYDDTKTMDISTTKNDWYYQCRIVIADKYGNMKQRNELVQMRGRGNSTWTWVNSGKRAFRLKFPSKTKLLAEQDANYTEINNYADAKSWTLLANAFDKTLIHNAFTYELGKNKLTNLPFCPAYRFVDLFVNNVYYGTYQVSDQVQVDKNRVNVNSNTGWFLEITASKNGDFLEEPYITVNGGQLYANIKNPEDALSGTNTFNEMSDYLTRMYGMLSSEYDYGHDFSYKTGYRTLIDMPSLIDWFIGEEISANYDGTYGNIFTYREAENDKLHFGPMWDLDIAYGGHEGATMAKKHIWDNTSHAYEGTSNMLRTLWADKYFVRDLYMRWQEIYNSGELKTFCEEKIEMLAGIVAQSQAKNYTIAKPFNIPAIGISTADNMGGSFASYDEAITYFKNYVKARIDWLNDEYKNRYDDPSLDCANLNPCDEFGHIFDTYLVQADGSYKKGCSTCKTQLDPSDTQTYYQFLVYPESKKSTTLFASSWQPSEDKPNSIAVVEAKQEVVERIEGYNIIAGKKNEAGNLTCKDFRLTDGHPYYGDNKFVATSATYSRNISNEWGTVILPYKFQHASTECADFYHLSSANMNGESSTLLFTPINPDENDNASAYVPVVFKAKENVTVLNVNGENITVKKKSAADEIIPRDVDGWTLTGSVEPITVSGEGIYYIKSNKFWHATGELSNPAFRAYFTNSNPVSNGVKMFSLAVEGDETRVENTPLENAAKLAVFVVSDGVVLSAVKDAESAIYGVNGALVHKASMKAGDERKVELPAGVYMVNGVKFIIK